MSRWQGWVAGLAALVALAAGAAGAKVMRFGAVLALAGLLSACQGGGGQRLTGLPSNGLAPQSQGQFGVVGEPVKVALLLPLSSKNARVRSVAKSLKEAAELALFDFSTPNIVLIPKDTRGTAAGATFAATQAIEEGAKLILGPLRAQAARAAGQVARKTNVPVVAFSTTESVAGNGIYLLSFLPSLDVARIVDFATQRGTRKFAALVPANGYGNVVAGDMTRIVQEGGGTLFTVERFALNAGAIAKPVQRLAKLKGRFDALLIATGAPLLGTIARRIERDLGGSGQRIQLLGTGVWNDPAILSEPALEGAWFAGPAPGTRKNFEDRYRSTYGRAAPQIASLGYDAVSLAAALARGPVGQQFSQSQITDPNGFAGVDGLFRFRRDGRIERGLAILEISGGTFRVLDPPPRSFPGTGF
ncbi:MAG: penicillin-binding protein activator [Alphaproteobacteria bacterium]